MKIYKYPLTASDIQEIEMPEGAHILCIQVVKDQPVLYARVFDDNAYYIKIVIRIYGTGHECEVHNNYIGSFQLYDGDFVGHVFDISNEYDHKRYYKEIE